MKKRSKPIVLFTFLVLLVGAAAFMNFSSLAGPSGAHNHEQQQQQQQQQEPPTQGAPRASTTSPKALAQRASQAVRGGTPQRSAEGPGGPPDKPLIAREKPRPYKPMPNDSSVGGQWWTDQGAKDYSKK